MIENTLESLGFRNKILSENYQFPRNEFYNETQDIKICIKDDSLLAFRVSPHEDILQLHLNFIPEEDLLRHLLQKTFYLI